MTGTIALTSLAAKLPKPHPHGTDILHFSVRKTMENSGLLTNATGSVNARRNQQGHANNQRLDINASQLETNQS